MPLTGAPRQPVRDPPPTPSTANSTEVATELLPEAMRSSAASRRVPSRVRTPQTRASRCEAQPRVHDGRVGKGVRRIHDNASGPAAASSRRRPEDRLRDDQDREMMAKPDRRPRRSGAGSACATRLLEKTDLDVAEHPPASKLAEAIGAGPSVQRGPVGQVVDGVVSGRRAGADPAHLPRRYRRDPRR